MRAGALVRRFGKGAKTVEAVRGVDLDVAIGEIFGLLGPNGAGKTTLLRMLTGQLDPSSGKATVAGCDVVRERRELHRRIGVVFDVPNMYDQLTGRQNLVFFADLYRVDRGQIQGLLELVEMADAADRRFKTYSKGMKQRVLLARALLPQPNVLFLDEPTSGLDPASARRMREIIVGVKTRGTSVVLTTHAMELADIVCDRLAIIDEGEKVAEGTPPSLKAQHSAPVIQVRRSDGAREEFPLAAGETADRVAAALRGGDVVEVATLEPTLEDVFLGLTGKQLT